MRKILQLRPLGFPCKFKDCPPGLFLVDSDVHLKTEYFINHIAEAYCESGEYFSPEDRENVIVQPLEACWASEENV